MTKVKGAAKVVDPAGVAPNWKVLQMKLEEEARDAELAKAEKEAASKDVEMAETSEAGDDDGFIVHLTKKQKKQMRKRRAVEVMDVDEPSAKKPARLQLDETRPTEKNKNEKTKHEKGNRLEDAEDGKEASASNKDKEGTSKSKDGDDLKGLTKVVALDCEYVGSGPEGRDDVLARVSIVNEHGETVYNKYVKPLVKVTDYRTHVSGIRAGNLVNGEAFKQVQLDVHRLLADRIVVGHAVHNDFRVLGITHPRRLTRDTARYPRIRELAKCGAKPSLKLLAEKLLGIEIQKGEHDSIIDAKVALRIYQNLKKKWEADVRRFKK